VKHWYERGEPTGSPLVEQGFSLRLKTSGEEGGYP